MIKIIQVDENDRKVGIIEKFKAHQGKGILHRAFTVFIFNSKNQLLIQKRSRDKFLWPLYWEASCSSHPLPRENLLKAGEKRLKKELEFNCKLKVFTKFRYQAKYKNLGSENEVCALLVGRHNSKIKPNPKEVADWQWIDIKRLKKEIIKNPRRYAPWLKIALKYYYENSK